VTDRDSFLAAIRADPADDVVRLAFADWLDEHGESDRDAATVEFIRLSCDLSGKGRMPKPAYRWIETNWRRLIPRAVGAARPIPILHGVTRPITAPPINTEYRMGRVVACRVGLSDGRKVRRYSMSFEFHRGFLLGWRRFSLVADRILAPLLLSDQPLFAPTPLLFAVDAVEGTS
jgi:uncharacterized protein (TIGR02996 family)